MVDDPKQGGEELHHAPEQTPKGPFAEREEAVLNFWNTEGIFEQSLNKPAPKGEYVFYDGPPFATGLPHYGHLLQSALKDAIPRYRTMRGYRVPRVWGWDCHGLPLENIIEAELGVKTKRDIEAYGIGNFNEAARAAVMRYAGEWRRIINRFGRWADMENDYKTMDTSYTESVWWAFKSLYAKGLIYEGFKSMHFCPRCGTTLSNFEVAQGYKDIDDIAVTVRLPLADESDTALLVWTTTPWTLPGNAAAAVNPDAIYVKARVDNGFVIVAKERARAVLGDRAEIVAEIEGKRLVGKRYEPPFGYYKEELHKHKMHAWCVYGVPFVTMDSGTGIVHIAPAFGADDLELANKEKIPLIHHVTEEGKFNAKVADFAGLAVKPKGNPRESDAKVAAHLAERGFLFAQEKINHSYPHCWRCDTPLLNWAANSWFVRVSSLKPKLLKENGKVRWVPEHVGTGRFHNGLQSAPDWAISRSRYWGAPLPVWRNTKTKEVRVAGSVNEMLSLVRRSGNRYFVMRHGEAEFNAKNMLDPRDTPGNRLTEKGKREVAHTAAELRREQIDLIVASPFLRTKETAELVRKELGLAEAALMLDERLHEFNEPDIAAVRRRMGEFIFEIERRYSGKNILIVSHGNPLWVLQQVAARKASSNFSEEAMLKTGEVRELPFTPFPHNGEYELDLHRPYIDEVPMGNTLTGEWKRIPDVFDCWFESGAMPFASKHFPIETSTFNPRRAFGLFPKGYPAHFIAESIDQTRGWFYSLIVLGTALFGATPYRAVVTNGLILASDGRKMSKKLKNYPDPMEVVEKYGADALRYYLLSSPVIRGEDLRFNEKGVDEVQKKLLMRLDNVRSFYETYAVAPQKLLRSGEMNTTPTPPRKTFAPPVAQHILDRWILSRLGQLVQEATNGFEGYHLDAAARPLMGFVDDLSTWYLRRSRDRFKQDNEDKEAALATLHHVFHVVSRVMAPVMPFYADDLWRRVRGEGDPPSVHLSEWPAAPVVDEALLRDMELVRQLASKGLESRERAGIKIRQPLAALYVAEAPASDALRAIVADEVNVKAIVAKPGIEHVELDTDLTPELKEEGMFREIIRSVQATRKERGLSVSDRARFSLPLSPEEAAVAKKHAAKILEITNVELEHASENSN